jgi:hypothetical protein
VMNLIDALAVLTAMGMPIRGQGEFPTEIRKSSLSHPCLLYSLSGTSLTFCGARLK